MNLCRKHHCVAGAFAWLAGAVSLHAYVAKLDDGGAALKWSLKPPFPPASFSVPTNSLNRSTRAIRYYLHAEAWSETNRQRELNAVRAAFAQWQSIPHTTIQFEEAGILTGEIDVNTKDGTNVVYWVKGNGLFNGETASILGRAAVTLTSRIPGASVIAEADIALNGSGFDWSTDFSTRSGFYNLFVEGIALHEIGHLLGLAHSPIGGATMHFMTDAAGSNGVIAGLSSDEIAFADFTYGKAERIAALGAVRGAVKKNGVPVYGASILLEDQNGNIVTGSVTRRASRDVPDGHFLINGIPPGNYHLRALPLDSDVANEVSKPFPARPNCLFVLLLPREISSDKRTIDAESVDTSFLPSANLPVSIVAGETAEMNLAVKAGEPALRIAAVGISSSSRPSETPLWGGVSLRSGDEKQWLSIFRRQIPQEGISLRITGPGIDVLSEDVKLFGDIVRVSAQVSVANNASPGLRSFVLQTENGNAAYAPGYLEILPRTLDYNFDGLDDLYQRQFFDPFTSLAADPDSDPDQDGFSNREEFLGNSNPLGPASLPQPMISPFEILSVSLDENGSAVTFESIRGAQYQLFSRPDLAGSSWEKVGEPVTASGARTTILDASAKEEFEFYYVQSVP